MKKMDVHKIFCWYILIIPQLLCAQTSDKLNKDDTIDVTYSFFRQFDDIQIDLKKSLPLTFDSISKREYLDYQKEYKPDLRTDSTRISFHNRNFFLTAGDTVFKSRCSETPRCAEYLGYYPILDCFMIGLQGPGVYFRFLIDRKTAKGLSLPKLNYDFADGTPMISPNGKSMVYSITDHFEVGASIVFIDIENHPDILGLNSCYTYDTSEWWIDEMTWVNNRSIALKIYEEPDSYGEPKIARYLKAEIKKLNIGANKK